MVKIAGDDAKALYTMSSHCWWWETEATAALRYAEARLPYNQKNGGSVLPKDTAIEADKAGAWNLQPIRYRLNYDLNHQSPTANNKL